MNTMNTLKFNTIGMVLLFSLLTVTLTAQVGVKTITPNSTLEVNGSMAKTVTTVTGNTTLDETHSIIICNNGATAITITLPTAVDISGRMYTIKREASSTANITIATTSSQTIDKIEVTPLVLTNQKEAVTVVSDGANWKKLSSNESNNIVYPMGELSFFSKTGFNKSITETTDGITNMTLINAGTTFSGNSEFDSPSNGILRYIGTKTKSFHIACTISMAAERDGRTDDFAFSVAKTGVVIPASRVIITLAEDWDNSTAIHVMIDLAYNDTLSLYAGNFTSGRDVDIKSINLFAMGMYMGN